jgi:hypothetical protein
MTRREMQINQVYHSCYSFFIITFALAKSKTVRQPLRADTHFLLRASLSLHSQKQKLEDEDKDKEYYYDNCLDAWWLCVSSGTGCYG